MSTRADVRIVDGTDPTTAGRSYLPGMGKNWLTPFFDAFVGLIGMRGRYARTAELAGVRDGESVLDVGCGTGSLLMAVLDTAPGAKVTGLDPDPRALEIAARKLRRARRKGTLVRGFADRLPADDDSVDHVLSSLALHHVPERDRAAFAREVARVLRPGGKVTILDMGGGEPGPGHHPDGADRTDDAAARPGGQDHGAGHGHPGLSHLLGHLAAPLRHRGRRSTVIAANLGDGIPRLLTEAGLEQAREVAHEDWPMGRLTYVQAGLRQRGPASLAQPRPVTRPGS
ncbi:class I SAM-dependent methyltransferase [Myceligenerans indicum]|uniref:Class I SAM-dependent methyltransferase n=1 Tax=Myceligenerans indicum TaxID=2593663 RepID=A0ABS1LKL1_9MICO|nr:class I SAM-dependent methyltransferase [Myceligenerans indicum]MBL0886097.1 class I SAM-dependent methyltransferase [Myceligenerans indicum]